MKDKPNSAQELDMDKVSHYINSLSLATELEIKFLPHKGDYFITSGTQDKKYSSFCDCVGSCTEGLNRCIQFKQEAGRLSDKLGESYISRCHAGVVVITASITVNGEYRGCISCSPIMMWDWDELAVLEIIQRTTDLDISPESLLVASRSIQVLSSKRAQAIGNILNIVAKELSVGDSTMADMRREANRQQAELAELVLDNKRSDMTLSNIERKLSGMKYPMHKERELLGKVRLGDRSGAREILNELLGHIFYKTAGNMDVMKARTLELIVMVSRAAVESGAELEKLLGMNYNYIAELALMTQFEDVCQWVVKVLDTFMDTVYETRNVNNTKFLVDAMEYIRINFKDEITLEDTANKVHVSPFYLSHIFKQELGITFIEYLTMARIEEAKRLLSEDKFAVQEISTLVGYEDPSYFSKVFKKIVGITPNKFRKAL